MTNDQQGGIWLPPTARAKPDDPVESLLAPGATVFIVPRAFGWWTLPTGDPHGRERVPAVEIEFELLRERAIGSNIAGDDITFTSAGITSGMGESPESMDEFPDGPKLLVELDGVTYLIGPIRGAPREWYPALMDGFALIFDEIVAGAGGRRPNMVTAPLHVGEHVVVEDKPEPEPETQGRNEPCACGSGRKFKKCHGAIIGEQ